MDANKDPDQNISQPQNLISSNLSSQNLSDPIKNGTLTIVTNITNTTPPGNEGNKKKKIKFLALGLVLGIFLLLGGMSATLAAVAYDKISLGNPTLEGNIKQFVVGLPFMPKTPEFILQSAVDAHATHTKHAFNLSLSAEGDESISGMFGMNKFDIEAVGDIDYTDSKNVMFSINASITKDFNVDLRKKDPIIYFKVNKIPAMIYSYVQIDQQKAEPVLTQWVQYDTSTLETEASQLLDEGKVKGKSLTAQYLEGVLDDLLSQNVLEKVKVSEEEADGVSAYLFDLEADPETTDILINRMNDRIAEASDTNQLQTKEVKPSEYIKDLKIKVWVEKSTYLVRKIATTFEYDQEAQYRSLYNSMPSNVLGMEDVLGIESYLLGSSAGSKFKVASVVGLSDFGKSISVEVPAQAVKPEEIMNQIMELSLAQSGRIGANDPEEREKMKRDAKRKEDIGILSAWLGYGMSSAYTNDFTNILCANVKAPCVGNSITGTTNLDGTGWAKMDLTKISGYESSGNKLLKLPVDPVNDEKYHYTYCSDGKDFEIGFNYESEDYRKRSVMEGKEIPEVQVTGTSKIYDNNKLINKASFCKY